MSRAPSVAVVAASSVVPRMELEAGVQRLRDEHLAVRVDDRCLASHFTYAGTDDDRAASFWAAAADPSVEIVWMARGGYGAGRLLPILADLAARHGNPPRKLLVGYSDVTVLHEFVRTRWGWSTLHAPMPAAASFGQYDKAHWRALIDLVHGRHPHRAWGERPLTWLNPPKDKSIEAEIVGGNLALWASAVGTPFAPTPGKGRMVFFEDVGERFYRLDRMLTQVRQAGLLDRAAAAVLLGDFTDCDDDPPSSSAPPTARKPRSAPNSTGPTPSARSSLPSPSPSPPASRSATAPTSPRSPWAPSTAPGPTGRSNSSSGTG
jgi:muramoyltetrapeptide carboxypeptidase